MNDLRRRSGGFAWLALCALAVLQFSSFQHESEHALDQLAESCSICIQIDGSTAVDPALDEREIPSFGAQVQETRDDAFVVVARIFGRLSRAPPSV